MSLDTMTAEEKLIKSGFLAKEDVENEDKFAEAVEQYEYYLGSNPFEVVHENTLFPEITEQLKAVSPKNPVSERRVAMKQLVEREFEEETNRNMSRVSGRFDDIYRIEEHAFIPTTFDSTNDHPSFRQRRVDSFLLSENNILQPLRDAGRLQVYKGNPRKNW